MQTTQRSVAEREKDFLTPRDAAQLYGGTPALWRKLARTRRLPAYRLGAVLIVFRREDIERYFLSNKVMGPASCRDGRRRSRARKETPASQPGGSKKTAPRKRVEGDATGETAS